MPDYKSLLEFMLPILYDLLADSSSESLTSILLRAFVLASSQVFKTSSSSSNEKVFRRNNIDLQILRAQRHLRDAKRHLDNILASPVAQLDMIHAAQENFREMKGSLKSVIKDSNRAAAKQRDDTIDSVLKKNPRKLYSAMKRTKGTLTPALHSLSAGGKT